MIKVIYNKVCGRCVQSEPLTSGMVGQPIEFEYSSDFDGLTLTAVFTNGKTTVDVLNPGNQCIIPHEVLSTPNATVSVGIYATRGNELVIPTVYATIGVVLKGADPSGDVSIDPTLPVWAQTQAMIGNLNDLTTQAKNNLVAAINEAAQSGGGGSSIALDTTLTQSGKAADAKAVGDALADKQDKLIAGDNITISEDGKTISATGGGGSVQSDWNQNDSTAADYVKNRPFYTGNPVETVLVEESTVSFAVAGGLYMGRLSQVFSIIVGETYKVYWDSTAYECTCVNSKGMLVLGNLSIPGFGSDTGEPFVLAVNISQETTDIFTTDTSASHTISISGLASEIVKINKKYLPFLPKPDGESYLTFSSPNSFSLNGVEKTWDGTLEYFALDGTWTVWDGTSSLSAEPNLGGYAIYLRGTGNTVITGVDSLGWQLSGSDIAFIGNIETLLDYATVESGEHPVMTSDCFSHMFNGCTGLTQAPELPATTLAPECYYCMFKGCTGLTQAPELPATTLADMCYCNMFDGCTGLTQAPELPATTLAVMCYNNMFKGCTSLKLSTTKTEEYTQEYRIPFSGDGTTATNALYSMFNSTGGTFTGTPQINTTYYLSSENMIVRGTEIATLNGYVKNMIDAAECIIPSSTPNSTKKFKITVDDSGTLSATEVTE